MASKLSSSSSSSNSLGGVSTSAHQGATAMKSRPARKKKRHPKVPLCGVKR
jgi:hypothetical protein